MNDRLRITSAVFIALMFLLGTGCIATQQRRGQSFESYYNAIIAGEPSKDYSVQINHLREDASRKKKAAELSVIHMRLSELLASPNNPNPDCIDALEALERSLHYSLESDWTRSDISTYHKRLTKLENSIKKTCDYQRQGRIADLEEKLLKCEDNIKRLQSLDIQMEQKKRSVR